MRTVLFVVVGLVVFANVTPRETIVHDGPARSTIVQYSPTLNTTTTTVP